MHIGIIETTYQDQAPLLPHYRGEDLERLFAAITKEQQGGFEDEHLSKGKKHRKKTGIYQ